MKYILLVFGTLITWISSGQNYNFTSAGVTGDQGPTQAQINSAYSGTSLDGKVDVVGGIQYWVVPQSGLYAIQANGAQGFGPFGGRGASMAGEFFLIAGDTLKILVGQMAGTPLPAENNQYGGGGGSFVTYTNNTPLIVGGGGGGNHTTAFSTTCDASTSTSGNTGANGPTNGAGGTAGSGGATGNSADGGGGLLTDGGGTAGGDAFVNGGIGGTSRGIGGFGGGGGTSSWNNRRGGGGGGYSGGGGAGSTTTGFPEGGGGGSFNSGLNPVNLAGVQTGDGQITISVLSSGAADDAGVVTIDSPTEFCPGTENIDVTIQNFGTTIINSVTVNWSVDGVAQTPYNFTGVLDTVGGSGSSAAQITLGTYTFGGASYSFRIWTASPNGVTDTFNSNDTIVRPLQPNIPAPGNITVTNTTTNAASITFSSTFNDFQIEWGPVGFTQGTSCLVNINSTTGALTFGNANAPGCANQLQPNTTYEFYMRSACSAAGNGFSTWEGPYTFTTACAAFTAPYSTGFENDALDLPPVCWLDYVTGTSAWVEVEDFTGTAAPFAGGQALYLYSGSSSTTGGDTLVAITPQFSDLSAGDKRLRFMANSDGPASQLIIGTMATPSPTATFNAMDTIVFQAPDTYEEVIVNFTTANGYNGTDEFVVLAHTLGSTFQYVRIDEFNYETIPACVGPSSTSLVVNSATSSTANVSWGTGGQGDFTKIEWGPLGFTPGNGTSATVASGTTTYNITGLASQTDYEFYIQDSCIVGGAGIYLGPVAFTTACAPLSTPYTESFDNTTIPACWSTFSSTGENWTFGSNSYAPSTEHTGNGGEYATVDDSESPSSPDVTLESPFFDVSSLTNPELTFFLASADATVDFSVDVWDGTSWNTSVFFQAAASVNVWDSITVNLTPFAASGIVAVRFVVDEQNGTFQNDIAIDDVTIASGPACPSPVGLDMRNLSDVQATAFWATGSANNTYQVWYGPQGFFQGTQTAGGTRMLSTTDSLQISGLTELSCYEVLLRSICGPGDTSAWIGPISFCTFCTNQLNGTYTIGGAAGPNNFPTIDSAISVLNGCGVSGPVTFNIASGTYNEQALVGPITGGSATNTVVFQADPANTAPVIMSYGATTTSDNYIWNFNGAEYITIRGLTLTATGTTYARIIDFNGLSRNIVIEDNILNGLPNATTTSTNIAVIMNNTTANNRLDYSAIHGNQINGGSYALYWYGVGTTDMEVGNRIDSNTIDGFYYAGIWSYYQDTITTIGNTINSLGTYTTVYGIRHYYNDNVTSVGNKIVARGTSTNYGYYIYYNDATAGNHSLVANNMVSAIDNSGTTYGMYVYNCTYMDIVHNSINVNAGSSTAGHAMYFGGTTGLGTAVQFINNIAVNSGGGVALEVTSAAVSMISNMNYNNYFAIGNDYADWGGTVVSDLAALQTASSLDANSVSGDPVFLAGDDLHALGSVPNNVATTFAGITTDIDGDMRSTTTPDMGADEFVPLAGDLSLLSGEFRRGECLGNTDSIVLNIQNLIGPLVDFSLDPLTVNYDVTGPVNTSGTLLINSGTLPSSDTLVLVETGIDMSVPGIYTLNAYLSFNAVNTLDANDTLVSIDIDVPVEFLINPKTTNLPSALDSVEICVESSFFGGGEFKFTEVCHFRGSSTGAPSGGWPSYLTADDYLEISGSANADLDGYTMEQWSTTSLNGSITFGPGTVLSPNGTAILMMGAGAGADDPANYMYDGRGTSTATYGSGGAAGRILKDPNGNIVDAVGYGTSSFSFPASAGVTTEWTGGQPSGSGTAGIRLVGPDTDDGTNWVTSSASNLQDPNTFNAGVPTIQPAAAPGLTWTLAGSSTVIDTNTCIMAGPYTTGGTYQYIASYSNACGTYTDTATVIVPSPTLDDASIDSVWVASDECGDSATEVYVAFTNLGANNITSLPISVTVSGGANTTITGTYTGNLPQLAKDTLMVGTVNTVAGGITTFSADLNLVADQAPANDTLTVAVELADALAPIPTAAIDTVCGAGAFDTLYFPVGSDDDYYWITTDNDTIGSSDSLVVGPLGTNDTTFVLSAVAGVSAFVGPVDNSMGAAANFVNADVQQLYFTAIQEFTIKEMTVYPNGNGNVNVNLIDAGSGATLQTVTVPVTGVTTPGTAQRITVNMTVPPGSYELHGGGSTTGGLWRNSAGASYPYSVPGVVDITGNSFGATYYYYFYNWEISTGSCPKPDGQITIYNLGGNVNASFTSTPGAPTLADLTVNFDASASTGANSYSWNFGDGNTGTGVNPSHTYTSNGNYTVTLVADGDCGADTITNTVVIQGIGITENALERALNVYPNPATNRLNVSFDQVGSADVSIRLLDASGRMILNIGDKLNGSFFEKAVDVSDLASGVYILEIKSGDLKANRRVSITR